MLSDIAAGFTVIPISPARPIKPIGIGKGLRTKINANIGTSRDKVSFEEEMVKLEILVRHGADAVMDLSTGGPIKEMRRTLIGKSPLSVGTVPIYEAAIAAAEKYAPFRR